MTKRFDVVGIGNAMVDVLARCDDEFLGEAGVEKGIMQLIDMERAVDLYARVGPAREGSGGSAANPIAAIERKTAVITLLDLHPIKRLARRTGRSWEKHDPDHEVPEENWLYRFAKKNWFFGFGAYT